MKKDQFGIIKRYFCIVCKFYTFRILLIDNGLGSIQKQGDLNEKDQNHWHGKIFAWKSGSVI